MFPSDQFDEKWFMLLKESDQSELSYQTETRQNPAVKMKPIFLFTSSHIYCPPHDLPLSQSGN